MIDEGAGGSEAARARMFDRYWRGSADGEGRGLGLALVKAVPAARRAPSPALSRRNCKYRRRYARASAGIETIDRSSLSSRRPSRTPQGSKLRPRVGPRWMHRVRGSKRE